MGDGGKMLILQKCENEIERHSGIQCKASGSVNGGYVAVCIQCTPLTRITDKIIIRFRGDFYKRTTLS